MLLKMSHQFPRMKPLADFALYSSSNKGAMQQLAMSSKHAQAETSRSVIMMIMTKTQHYIGTISHIRQINSNSPACDACRKWAEDGQRSYSWAQWRRRLGLRLNGIDYVKHATQDGRPTGDDDHMKPQQAISISKCGLSQMTSFEETHCNKC